MATIFIPPDLDFLLFQSIGYCLFVCLSFSSPFVFYGHETKGNDESRSCPTKVHLYSRNVFTVLPMQT